MESAKAAPHAHSEAAKMLVLVIVQSPLKEHTLLRTFYKALDIYLLTAKTRRDIESPLPLPPQDSRKYNGLVLDCYYFC